ncbi:MAG: hypothetical protein U0N15_05320 [Bifidobacterium choerinum]
MMYASSGIRSHPSHGASGGFRQGSAGVVTGKPIKDLKVDKIAGASWTSDAFNAALDEVRRQVAQQH